MSDDIPEVQLTGFPPGLKLAPAPRLAHISELGIDEATATIYLDGEIDETTGPWFWLAVDQLGASPVHVELNTPGGDVDSMFAIHDAIRRHGNVHVTAYGQVCSAGVLILACAQHRAVTESCILMSHEPTLGTDELGYRASRDRMKAHEWQHRWWCELMARYTPQDAEWWQRKTERKAEYWLLGGAAIVGAGLADEVV